jgi:hypothetical protein
MAGRRPPLCIADSRSPIDDLTALRGRDGVWGTHGGGLTPLRIFASGPEGPPPRRDFRLSI